MSQTIELPDTVFHTASTLAEKHGISIEDFLTLAINERLSLEEETEHFFAERSAHAVEGAWRAALDAVPDRPADPQDARP
jgi:hypothetical protein